MEVHHIVGILLVIVGVALLWFGGNAVYTAFAANNGQEIWRSVLECCIAFISLGVGYYFIQKPDTPQ